MIVNINKLNMQSRNLIWIVIAEIILLFTALALLAACTRPTPSNPIITSQLNQEFTLKVGQTAVIKEEELTIRFLTLIEDSRCPRRVQCVQAGQAQVSISIRQEDRESLPFTLNTNPQLKQDRASFADYEIQLRALDPYPEEPVKPNPNDYQATLFVTKK